MNQVKSRYHIFIQRVCKQLKKRIGAKLVPEMMENVTTPDQYELLKRVRSAASLTEHEEPDVPPKKDRRNLEEFTTPEFMDDFDFEFDFR